MERSLSGSASELMNGGIMYSPITRQRQTAYYSYSASSSPAALIGTTSGGSTRRYSTSLSAATAAAVGSSSGGGSYDALADLGVKSITVAREKEKKDMQDLNSRFANYIEKNRFLEAQLKAIEQKLKDLQAKWGKETVAVKQMYETELRQVRDLYNGAENVKAKLELRVRSLEDQLAELRRKLDDYEKERAQNRNVISTQIQQLSDFEAELIMLRRRTASLESDNDATTKDRSRLQDELFKVAQERDTEKLNSVELAFRVESLIEEAEFLKQVHEQQVKELMALSQQDTYAQNRKFWEGEMSSAIRELQKEFDIRIEQNISKQESYYQMKVQEMRTNQAKDNGRVDRLSEETRRLQGTLTEQRAIVGDLELRNGLLEKQYNELLRQHEEDLRSWDEQRARGEADAARLTAECERLLRDMEAIMNSKLSLELEIAAYRKLLESEETRMLLLEAMNSDSTAARSSMAVSRTSVGGGGSSGGFGDAGLSLEEEKRIASQLLSAAPGETGENQLKSDSGSHKATFTRSARGPLTISRCDPAGEWVEIENTGRKTEQLDRWQIGRKVDGDVLPFFTFPADFSIAATKGSRLVRVYATGKGPEGSLQYSEPSFGAGSVVITTLLNDQGEVKADHVQKINYAV